MHFRDVDAMTGGLTPMEKRQQATACVFMCSLKVVLDLMSSCGSQVRQCIPVCRFTCASFLLSLALFLRCILGECAEDFIQSCPYNWVPDGTGACSAPVGNGSFCSCVLPISCGRVCQATRGHVWVGSVSWDIQSLRNKNGVHCWHS